ncbi:MAG TPA: taurine catabolism dioxygenase TauD, partial [Gallionellaceae bacterium]|nr:taurine catabolism dioxygenase TauD [Gallionellaceae bacterium]
MSNPFDLTDNGAYQRWRERKLAQAITAPDDLIVEIADPAALIAVERNELLARCRRSNMAIYATRADMDERTVQQLGAQLGLLRLDANWLAG